MTLTDVKIRNLKPKGRPYKVADFDGLYIHVTAKGSKLWCLKYRILGKEKLLAIGAYCILTVVDDFTRENVALIEDTSVRARDDTAQDQRHNRQLISVFLLRHGRIYHCPKNWTMRYRCWLQRQYFDHPAQHIAEVVLLFRTG